MSEWFALNFRATSLTLSLDYFFICQTCLTARAPVDWHSRFIRQSHLVQLHKNPLGPFVVRRIRRVYLTIPVVRESQPTHLLSKAISITLRQLSRVHLLLNSGVLCRQSKRIPARWVQNPESFGSHVARHDVSCGVIFYVSNMETIAGWIGKEIKHIQFLAGARCRRCKRLGLQPLLLPLRFDFLRFIRFCAHNRAIVPL